MHSRVMRSSLILLRSRPNHRALSHAVLRKIPIIVADGPNPIDWKELFNSSQPIIIRGLVSSWPAISDKTKQWSNLLQLKHRTEEDCVVPVEMGASYMDKDLKKASVGLGSLLDYFMLKREAIENSPRVYWAQNDLNTVPEMFADVKVPDMCFSTGKNHLYNTNVWFNGALGSSSPCHFDPFHNLLCQVVGKKEVTVFSPEFGQTYLYPAEGTKQKNTSLINMEAPDHSAYPLYSEALKIVNERLHTEAVVSESTEAKIVENEVRIGSRGHLHSDKILGASGVLEVGDALYIPYKWWHYCSTGDVSCSVNFWWL